MKLLLIVDRLSSHDLKKYEKNGKKMTRRKKKKNENKMTSKILKHDSRIGGNKSFHICQ